IDGAVNLTAKTVIIISKIKSWIDVHIVDMAVNLIAIMVGFCSALLRRMQTGLIQNYILIAFLGLAVIIFVKLMGG
ncbi:MAG: NADH-quinone oxidoreductase subunit L, partial [Candidatus Omnitrophota bacterium]